MILSVIDQLSLLVEGVLVRLAPPPPAPVKDRKSWYGKSIIQDLTNADLDAILALTEPKPPLAAIDLPPLPLKSAGEKKATAPEPEPVLRPKDSPESFVATLASHYTPGDPVTIDWDARWSKKRPAATDVIDFPPLTLKVASEKKAKAAPKKPPQKPGRPPRSAKVKSQPRRGAEETLVEYRARRSGSATTVSTTPGDNGFSYKPDRPLASRSDVVIQTAEWLGDPPPERSALHQRKTQS